MTGRDGNSRGRADKVSRRKVIGSLGTCATGLLAGCGVLGDNSTDPDTPPNTRIKFIQNGGTVEMLWHHAVVVEIIHDGGEAVDPERFSITIDKIPLEDHPDWEWDSNQAGEGPTADVAVRNWDSVGDKFKKDDAVAIRSNREGDRSTGAQGGEVVRLVWSPPEGVFKGDQSFAEYEVRECMNLQVVAQTVTPPAETATPPPGTATPQPPEKECPAPNLVNGTATNSTTTDSE